MEGPNPPTHSMHSRQSAVPKVAPSESAKGKLGKPSTASIPLTVAVARSTATAVRPEPKPRDSVAPINLSKTVTSAPTLGKLSKLVSNAGVRPRLEPRMDAIGTTPSQTKPIKQPTTTTTSIHVQQPGNHAAPAATTKPMPPRMPAKKTKKGKVAQPMKKRNTESTKGKMVHLNRPVSTAKTIAPMPSSVPQAETTIVGIAPPTKGQLMLPNMYALTAQANKPMPPSAPAMKTTAIKMAQSTKRKLQSTEGKTIQPNKPAKTPKPSKKALQFMTTPSQSLKTKTPKSTTPVKLKTPKSKNKSTQPIEAPKGIVSQLGQLKPGLPTASAVNTILAGTTPKPAPQPVKPKTQPSTSTTTQLIGPPKGTTSDAIRPQLNQGKSRTNDKGPFTGEKEQGTKRASPLPETTIGQLAQDFYQLIRDSKTGTADIAKAAQALGVPKRRIYDITNVLEGSGLTVKKSTNVIAWKSTSSRYTTPGSHAKHSTQEQMQSRISTLVEEEAMLDRWISRLQRLKESQISTLQMGASGIIEALYYPRDGSTPLKQPDIERDSGGDEFRRVPMHSAIAVHAPFGSFVQLPAQEQEHRHRLFVATHADLDQAEKSAQGNIRQDEEGAPGGRKKRMCGLHDVVSRSIEVYSLSIERDQDSQTIVSSGIRPVLQSPLSLVDAGLSLSSKRTYRDFAALEARECASDFFG